MAELRIYFWLNKSDTPPFLAREPDGTTGIERLLLTVGITSAVQFTTYPDNISEMFPTTTPLDLHRALSYLKTTATIQEPSIHCLCVPQIEYVAGNELIRPLALMFDYSMFDINAKPREAFALSLTPLLKETEHVQIRTILHEIGHCLNLIHTEDVPRDPDATIMTQTATLIMKGLFPGTLSLHGDDLSYLRNTPRADLFPGGLPFRGGLRFGAMPAPERVERFSIEVRHDPSCHALRILLSIGNGEEITINGRFSSESGVVGIIVNDGHYEWPARPVLLECGDRECNPTSAISNTFVPLPLRKWSRNSLKVRAICKVWKNGKPISLGSNVADVLVPSQELLTVGRSRMPPHVLEPSDRTITGRINSELYRRDYALGFYRAVQKESGEVHDKPTNFSSR